MRSLNIEPARDGGYTVKNVGPMNCIWEVLYAGSLEKCIEYIRTYYFVPAAPSKSLDFAAFKDFVGKYEDQHDPFSGFKA